MAVYPYLDGGGTSTELVVSAGDGEDVQSGLAFFATGGDPMEVIVR